MAGKHRGGKRPMGIGDIVLYGALIGLAFALLAFVVGVLGGSR